MKLKAMLMKVIQEDQHEYCFDRSYCSDKSWIEQNGEETREDAYAEVIASFEAMTVEEILEYTGDQYEYIVEKYKEETK